MILHVFRYRLSASTRVKLDFEFDYNFILGNDDFIYKILNDSAEIFRASTFYSALEMFNDLYYLVPGKMGNGLYIQFSQFFFEGQNLFFDFF